MTELFKLTGIVIVIIGLALRLRTPLVVVTAGIVTGIIAGLPLFTSAGFFATFTYASTPGQEGIINILGRAFAENRLMTLFIITLPAIGLAERYGLQEQSARFIKRISAATVGRLLITYQLFRVLMGILAIRLLGHPAFVRPLVFPMALGAAEAEAGARTVEAVPADAIERIKGGSAAAENYGNFYGQNLSPLQPGILLVYTVLTGLGYSVSVWSIFLYAIPIATLSIVIAVTQFLLFDWHLRKRLTNASNGVTK